MINSKRESPGPHSGEWGAARSIFFFLSVFLGMLMVFRTLLSPQNRWLIAKNTGQLCFPHTVTGDKLNSLSAQLWLWGLSPEW